MLTSDKFYRSFVLLPCEICVVPFGHRKIAADWNDIPLAKMKSTVVGLTHACASLCSFKHGYLSLKKYSLCKNTPLRTISKIVESILNRQADYISSSIRLATNAPMRRKAPLGTVAGQPGPLLVIRWLQAEKKNSHNV